MATYHEAVLGACSSDTWEAPQEVEQPVAMINELMKYHYDNICLAENGQFCNNVAAAFATVNSTVTDTKDLPAGGNFRTYDTSGICDSCLVGNLAFKAGLPYYDGARLRSISIYEAKTSSCGISTAPLTITTESILS